MTPRPVGFHFAEATLRRCRHTRHHHGWWCLRCLRAILPGGRALHHGRGAWEVAAGPVSGYGDTEVPAWQAAIERCVMDGEWGMLRWEDSGQEANAR